MIRSPVGRNRGGVIKHRPRVGGRTGRTMDYCGHLHGGVVVHKGQGLVKGGGEGNIGAQPSLPGILANSVKFLGKWLRNELDARNER
jgi:hypothetical protein